MNTTRLILAFLAASTSAIIALFFIILIFFSIFPTSSDPPQKLAFHFLVFGAIIIFPIAFGLGVPLFLIFKYKGWLSTINIYIGGISLSLIYPIYYFVKNAYKFETITFSYLTLCIISGTIAVFVFSKIMKLSQ